MRNKWFVVIIILLSTLISIPCFSEEGGDPICYLRFDEGEGLVVKDSSENGNNGKIMKGGKYTKWVEGKTGKALELSGDKKTRNKNGSVVINNMDKYDFSRGLTVEAWVRFNDKRKRPDTCEIVSNTVSDRGKGFRFMLSWNRIQLRSGEGGNGKIWGACSNPAKNPINNNVWYHVAGTYDGSVFKVYIDGEEVNASESGLILTKGQKTIYVSSYCGGYTYGFNGIIDEVGIYDYPKSALDILKDAKIK